MRDAAHISPGYPCNYPEVPQTVAGRVSRGLSGVEDLSLLSGEFGFESLHEATSDGAAGGSPGL
jgi:hypothetical protein